MANRLKMAQIELILALHRRGWSNRKIANELGTHRDTVARYLRLASDRAKQARALTGSDAVFAGDFEVTGEPKQATPAGGAHDAKQATPAGGAHEPKQATPAEGAHKPEQAGAPTSSVALSNDACLSEYGRVAPGVATRGSHRSVRAQLGHTAPRIRTWLRHDTPSAPPLHEATGSAAKESGRQATKGNPCDDADPATCARCGPPAGETAARRARCR